MKTETMEAARKAVLDRAKDGEYYSAVVLKENGNPICENTLQYVILKKEWDASHK